MEKKLILILILIIAFVFTLIACSKQDVKEAEPNKEIVVNETTVTDNTSVTQDTSLTISASPDSQYMRTFKDLNLGVLFDFSVEVPKADTSWLNLWVEEYSDGNYTEPTILITQSNALGTQESLKTQVGFGILNPNGEDVDVLLYSYNDNAKVSISKKVTLEQGITNWEYVIDAEKNGLEFGEEKIIAVYITGKDTLMSGGDYQDPNFLKEMIEANETVLFLKIKIEEK